MSARLAILVLLAVACATSRVPQQLRGYDVVVEGKDEQSVELARAMREYGYRVRQRVRGGSRPAAAVIHIIFADPGPGEPSWLYVRLADTRTGAIIGAGAVQLDSTVQSARARATAAVQAITPP